MDLEFHIPRRKPATKNVGGLLVPKYMFSDEKCLSGLAYKAQASDIFIVTYPKAGTTWMQYIVWEILHDGAPPPSMNDMLNEHVPFLELRGSEVAENLPPPRVMKTHIPFHLHPYHPSAKYIYVARNPKDTCVSYFHFVKEMPFMYRYSDATFQDFFECFLNGEVSYGSWFDHVLSWYEHKDDPNVLFFTYEEMKNDYKQTILDIAKFLGEKHYKKLSTDSNMLQLIIDNTNFANMKTLKFYMPKEGTGIDPDGGFPIPQSTDEEKEFHKVNFFWKGEVGNWRNYLNEEQERRLNEYVVNKQRGEEIAVLWKGL